MRDLKAGERLTFSYNNAILEDFLSPAGPQMGVLQRRELLQNLSFTCGCERCVDETAAEMAKVPAPVAAVAAETASDAAVSRPSPSLIETPAPTVVLAPVEAAALEAAATQVVSLTEVAHAGEACSPDHMTKVATESHEFTDGARLVAVIGVVAACLCAAAVLVVHNRRKG